MSWCLVAVGGAIGAVLRLALSSVVTRLVPSLFPWPTLLINSAGSFLLCWWSVLLVRRGWPLEWRLGVLVGLLGAFTTFSTFSYETLQLVQSRHFALAGANVVASFALCLGAGLAGFALGRAIE